MQRQLFERIWSECPVNDIIPFIESILNLKNGRLTTVVIYCYEGDNGEAQATGGLRHECVFDTRVRTVRP